MRSFKNLRNIFSQNVTRQIELLRGGPLEPYKVAANLRRTWIVPKTEILVLCAVVGCAGSGAREMPESSGHSFDCPSAQRCQLRSMHRLRNNLPIEAHRIVGRVDHCGGLEKLLAAATFIDQPKSQYFLGLDFGSLLDSYLNRLKGSSYTFGDL